MQTLPTFSLESLGLGTFGAGLAVGLGLALLFVIASVFIYFNSRNGVLKVGGARKPLNLEGPMPSTSETGVSVEFLEVDGKQNLSVLYNGKQKEFSAAELEQLTSLLKEGKMIEAIKMIRITLDLDLKDSKTIADLVKIHSKFSSR